MGQRGRFAVVDVWKLSFHKKTIAHVKNLKQAGLREKAKKVLDNIKADPFSPMHGFEKLVGDLKGFYSKRINIKHRVVYAVDTKALVVYICAIWTHYEDI